MKKRKPPKYSTHYTFMDELMASPSEPLELAKRTHHTGVIFASCDKLTNGTATTNDWRIVSDVVNMIETLTTHNNGWWTGFDGELVHMKDETGLLMKAITAMALAGKRQLAGEELRITADNELAMRNICESYAEIIEAIPARSMVKCHRLTEKRMQDILNGRKLPHDVELVGL